MNNGHVMKALVLLLLPAMIALAQSPIPSTGAASGTLASATACAAPEFRQFDFWMGKWLVKNREGKQVGTNELTRISGGCAMLESWKGSSGITGTSVTYFDLLDKKWHQDWVGSDGQILHLGGGLLNGVIVLTGADQGPQARTINRVTWTPLPPDKVKQEWMTSKDGGQTWNTEFLGFYERQP